MQPKGAPVNAQTLRRLSILAAVAVAAAIGIGGAAARSDGQAQASFTVTVGTALSLTGESAVFGPPFQKGAVIAGNVANRALQRAGTPIRVRVIHADDGSRPETAVLATRKLVSDRANCIAGHIQSASTIASANAAAIPAGIPIIAPASTSALITNLEDKGLVFRIAPSDVLQGPVLAAAIRQELGAGKRLSFAARNDAFGVGLIRSTQQAWTRLGGASTGPAILYDPNAASYASEAQRIVSGNPNAFVILDFPATFARVGAALLRTGRFDGSRLFIGGGQPSTIPSFVPRESMEGARGTRPAVPIGAALTRAYDALYQRSAGTKERQSLDVNEFDAAITCILAAVAANSNSGRAIANQLRRISAPPGAKFTYLNLVGAFRALRAGRDIDYEGVAGSIDWDSRGDPASATYDFYKYVRGTLTPQRQYRNLRGRVLRLDLTPPTKPRVRFSMTGNRVTFRITSRDPGNTSPPVTFRCALDKEQFRACKARVTRRVSVGAHIFRVFALDAQDNRGATTTFRFTTKR
jgi:ABC-type branched-subunit amino acid transport system substrate-binding protein